MVVFREDTNIFTVTISLGILGSGLGLFGLTLLARRVPIRSFTFTGTTLWAHLLLQGHARPCKLHLKDVTISLNMTTFEGNLITGCNFMV